MGGGECNSADVPTVENLIPRGVFLPIFSKILALQYFVMSCVTSKYPKAPAPIKIKINIYAYHKLQNICKNSKCQIGTMDE